MSNGIGGGQPQFTKDIFRTSRSNRVFRAVVHHIDFDVDTKRRTIYVQDSAEYGQEGANILVAIPPSPIPFSESGSGFIGIPDKGTECIVTGVSGEGGVQILSYTPHVEWSKPEGSRFAEPVEPGGFIMKVGGDPKAVLSLGRGGLASLFAGEFARISVDGGGKKIELKDKAYEHRSAVGGVINTYNEFDQRTGLAELTTHTEVYSQFFENPGNSDLSMETEGVNITAIAPYANKAVVRAGSIINRRIDTSLFPQHTYQIETRQSTGPNPLSKDTITVMRFGDQTAGNQGAYKYDSDIFTPPGTLMEIEIKKNTLLHTNSMLWRYGRYEDNIQSRSKSAIPGAPGIPSEQVKGEIFRHQIYEGITPGLAIPVVDPVAQGKGYEFEFPNTKAAQQYTESFGILDTPTVSNLHKSVWRRHIHGYDFAPIGVSPGLELTEIFGGENIFKQTITEKTLTTKNIYSHKITSDAVTIKFEVGGLTTTTYKVELGADNITISMEGATDKGSIQISDAGITIDAGTLPTNSITFGGSGAEQALVTKSWVDLMFATHMHPTAAPGPPSPPVPLPPVATPDNPVSPFTYQTKAE